MFEVKKKSDHIDPDVDIGIDPDVKPGINLASIIGKAPVSKIAWVDDIFTPEFQRSFHLCQRYLPKPSVIIEAIQNYDEEKLQISTVEKLIDNWPPKDDQEYLAEYEL